MELNQEKLELKYKKESLKDCIFKKNPDSGKIKLLMTDKKSYHCRHTIQTLVITIIIYHC